MILNSLEIFEQVLADGTLTAAKQKRPERVLMVSPEYFRVEYAINPFMTNAQGELNQVDEQRAREEWEELRATYGRLGFTVDTLAGAPGLPDMVFCANQSFPFLDAQGKKAVLLSNMRSEFRRGEVPYLRDWYEKRGYKVHEIADKNIFFEGNGDALIQYPYNLVWGGYGHRTSRAAYDVLADRFGFYVVPLELDRAHYYHIDLCLSIINETTAVIAPDAFTPEGLAMLRLGFANLIEVGERENLKYACCNCHSPDGKHVITQAGAAEFRAKIRDAGLVPVEVAVDEFFKSGGSVFCMKMMAF